MINARLRVIGGKHSNQLIPLSHKKFLIGREQDCQLRPNSELVSRHHCIFTVDDFSIRLRDLGSTNGTLVNGERIRKEVVLNAGDQVTVGSLEFEIQIGTPEEAPAPTTPIEDTMVQTGSDTLNEMPAISAAAAAESVEPMGDEAAETTSQAPADTEKSDAPPAAPAEPAQTEAAAAPAAPAAPVVAPEGVPPASAGDTTVIGQPILMPGQQPYQPMMPPMGYPQQPMYGAGYPYPGMAPQPMPMYPQQPGYPAAPGYPPVQPAAAQPDAAQPAAPVAEPGADSGAPEVTLPDPSETGAKEPEPAPPKPEGEEEAKSQDEKSNQSAAAIIQQHMQRRPGS